MSELNCNEQWRAVVGYEGFYEVSNLGRVRSLERTCRHRNGSPKKVAARILKTSHKTQYPKAAISKYGKVKYENVHVIVVAAFIGPRPSGCQINHRDGCKSNNRLENLEYCTTSENARHAIDFGLRNTPHGEGHSAARLTEASVMEIRVLRKSKTQKQIGQMFGVTDGAIRAVLSGRNWKHVNSPE